MTELILSHQNGEINLPETTLLVALDETGQEEFRDPNFQVFGIGGCACLVRDYQRLIETPWNFMCQRYFPEYIRPMHAAELLPGQLSSDQLHAFTHFFENFQFFRIATMASLNTINMIQREIIDIVGASLFQSIADISKWAEFDRVFVAMEESDRIETRVIQRLSGKELVRGKERIKVELGLVPKSASIPALEVADFIIHTAGAQTRNRISGKKTPRKDFETIFRNIDNRLVSFKEITKVEGLNSA